MSAGRPRRRLLLFSRVSPVERHLFRKDLRTVAPCALRRTRAGTHVRFRPTDAGSPTTIRQLNVPRVVAVGSTDGKFRREVFRADNPSADYNFCSIELGTVRSADDRYDNYYRLIKPLDFDPTKKYPVILYVYGGPHSQLVRNDFQASLRRWEMYMAQHGYVVFVMDNRGTTNRGAEYEKAIHPPLRQVRNGGPDGGLALADVARLGRWFAHRRTRLVLRRIHDYLSDGQLSGGVQGRRRRRSGH